MKNGLIYLLALFFLSSNVCYALENDYLPNISSEIKSLSKEEYRHKTVLKHYKPYEITITNNNSKPVLLSSNSEVYYLLSNDDVLKSESRRSIYRHSRKRDIGRSVFVVPGSLLAGAVIGATFGLGTPLALGIIIGTMAPATKAVRANVDISQDLMNEYMLPIRFEPKETYKVRMLVPKDIVIKQIDIMNVSFDMKKMYDMKIPVEAL